MALRAFNGVLPRTEEGVFVDPSAVVIGDVCLASNVSIWPGVVIRGDVNSITIGEETNIQDGAVLHVTHRSASNPEGYPLKVGKGVTVGHKAVLHGCTIGDLCLIGIGAIVMDGAIIEDQVMVGAGALVPPGKRLESGYLYVGSPARPSRPLKDEEIAYLSYSKDGYVRLKNQHQTSF
jgi:carbonic anhydrase/acetyltransferase-like protein (isoleucine patch superfamily)